MPTLRIDWNEPAIEFYKKLGCGAAGRVDKIPADGWGPQELGRRYGAALL